jgi:hypothetical protein
MESLKLFTGKEKKMKVPFQIYYLQGTFFVKTFYPNFKTNFYEKLRQGINY